MMAEEIRSVTVDNEVLIMLSYYILLSCQLIRAGVQKGPQPYWSFRDEISIIDGIKVKGKRIVIPSSLPKCSEQASHK